MALDYNTKKLIDISLVNRDYDSFIRAARSMISKKVDAIIDDKAANIDKSTDSR